MSRAHKPRFIGYARVSTLDQDPKHQVKALRAAGCDRVFTDHASGLSMARPELVKMLNCLVGGDTLIVWKIDRLGRSLQHLIEIVTSLAERAVHLRSLTQEIDTSSPMGKMVFHVLGALAQFERDLISERTKLAAEQRHKQGKPWGRPSVFHDPLKVAFAKSLLRSKLPRHVVAKRLGITMTALYKWFPGGKAENFGTGCFGANLPSSLSPSVGQSAPVNGRNGSR